MRSFNGASRGTLLGLLVGTVALVALVRCELAFPTRELAPTACEDDHTDIASDPANCGACGNVCDAGVDCYLGICGGKAVRQASAGLHACAVVAAGTVFCWGDNLFGETGSPTTTETCGTTACVSTPTPVAGLSDAVEVRAGYYSTCARTSDGAVWCWGRNDSGQLGHATSTMDCGSPCDVAPQLVAGLGPALAIDVGDGFACAVQAGGIVSCWGDDTYGTLGNGSVGGTSSAPVTVHLPAGFDASRVSASLSTHACALATDGKVACWGTNGSGELGHAPTSDAICAPTGIPCSGTPALVAGISAQALSAGDGVTCALTNSGAATCWGSNRLGQLGDGTFDDDVHASPSPGPAATFSALDGRYAFEIALGAETAYAWGSSPLGALGQGTVTTGMTCQAGVPCVSSPKALPSLSDVTAVAAGVELGLAVTAGGALWAWGANVDGRLGHAPGLADAGDSTTCGPSMNEICNPTPTPVAGFP